jgi:hypothetical protein
LGACAKKHNNGHSIRYNAFSRSSAFSSIMNYLLNHLVDTTFSHSRLVSLSFKISMCDARCSSQLPATKRDSGRYTTYQAPFEYQISRLYSSWFSPSPWVISRNDPHKLWRVRRICNPIFP